MRKSTVLIAALATAAPAFAQQQSPVKVPIRELAPTAARSTGTFGAILGLRSLPGGRVIVDDGLRRQVVMLDSTLSNTKVLIDSAAGAGSYGSQPAPIIPYLGDSTLFVDLASTSLLVIDPNGKVARVMSAPRANDIFALMGSSSGVDSRGRLIYRGNMARQVNRQMGGAPPAPGQATAMPQSPDSAPILRADFDTRAVDTIGKINAPSGQTMNMVQGADNKMTMKRTVNPLVSLDEWAVTSDGAVAFVRGHDYHVDWVAPDGSNASTGKMPFDWKRLSDEEKQALIDSARVAMDASQKRMQDAMKSGSGEMAEVAKRAEAAAAMGAMGGGGGGGGGPVMIMRVDGGGGGAAGAKVGADVPMVMGSANGAPINIETEFVSISQIADYYPPIRRGAVRADMDGNLWILPTSTAQSKAGELVYDIVNKKGEMTERVRIPAGRSVAGFGKGGIVYLMSGDRTTGFTLERSRVIGSTNVTQ